MSETRNPDFDADVLMDLWRTGMEADALAKLRECDDDTAMAFLERLAAYQRCERPGEHVAVGETRPVSWRRALEAIRDAEDLPAPEWDQKYPDLRAVYEESEYGLPAAIADAALRPEAQGEGEAEQDPRAAPLHRYVGQRSPEGYAVCEDCGARENTLEAARPCSATTRSEGDGE